MKLWDVASASEFTNVITISGQVRGLAWNPDGRSLAAAGWGDQLKILDPAGRILRTIKLRCDSVLALAYSPDGCFVAAGGGEEILIIDAASGQELMAILRPGDAVRSKSWSPDGSRLVAADDGLASIRDVRTGQEMHKLSGHSGAVYAIVWSPEGSRLATGSWDNTLRIWHPDPPGREKLVIELVPATSQREGEPGIYVSKDEPLWLAYGVATLGTYHDSNRDWGGFGGNRHIEIFNPGPAEGYCHFAPWRRWEFPNGPQRWPVSYTIRAEYFPPPPRILRIEPLQQTNNLVGTASITVVASGTGLGYRWEKRLSGGRSTPINSSPDPTAATATLVLQSVTVADDAEYRGIVQNGGGSATSAWARVSLRMPSAITTQPQPRTVMPGGSVAFNVTATGTAPLSYRWEHQDPRSPKEVESRNELRPRGGESAAGRMADTGAFGFRTLDFGERTE